MERVAPLSPEAETPFGIDRDRHLNLQGRDRARWLRRGALTLIAAIPVVALFDVFGQGAIISNASSPSATLTIDSPAHVRGGLIFTTRIVVRTRRDFHDMKLSLGRGWFEGMTFNGSAPQPSNESAEGAHTVWDYGSESAGSTFTIWISWQTNPTNVGRHPQDVILEDGDQQVLSVHRMITVFP